VFVRVRIIIVEGRVTNNELLYVSASESAVGDDSEYSSQVHTDR
jgi:hypothetical protein